jgi:uncharacterized protein YkwD
MTDERISTRERIASDELPDWADWNDEETTETNRTTGDSNTWLDETVAAIGPPEPASETPEGQTDATAHGRALTVSRIVCQQCGTTALHHHLRCTAPILRLGGQWRCGDCGVEVPLSVDCPDCGGGVDRQAVSVSLDMRPEVRPGGVERAIHAETNDRRRSHSRGALSHSSHLSAIALQHSRDMAHREFFAHTDPDGQAAVDRYREYGHSDRSTGENIAKIYPDRTASSEEAAKRVVAEWMASPGHRENILRDRFEREGIGVYLARDGALYATQNFY